MTTVVIALVSFALAFVAGALLSKAYFAVHGDDASRLNVQRRRYRKRISALQGVIQHHENAQDEIKVKLRDFQKSTDAKAQDTARVRTEVLQLRHLNEELRGRIDPLEERLTAEQQKAENAQNESSLLRIERDELTARVRRLEADTDSGHADAAPVGTEANTAAAGLRSDMGELREKLALRDREVLDLKKQLQNSEQQIQELLARLESWKHRVSPLTKKLKQQRNLIRKYREAVTTADKDSNTATEDGDAQTDNLKKIRGIGPALERRLHRHGIRRFEQIADLSEDELAEIAEQLAIAPNLVQRDRWVEQARELAGHATATA